MSRGLSEEPPLPRFHDVLQLGAGFDGASAIDLNEFSEATVRQRHQRDPKKLGDPLVFVAMHATRQRSRVFCSGCLQSDVQ
eukprot:1989117-Prorocentrum_lima.AAC.1